MIRVLQVIDSLGAGGAERSLAESVRPLRERGIHVTVAYFKPTTDGVQALVESSTTTHHLPGGRVSRIGELRSLIRQLRPDLVHTVLFEADLAGRLAAAGTGTPVLTSLVNTPYEPERGADANVRRSRVEAARFVEAVGARFLTTHVHAISQAVATSAVTRLHLPGDRITVAPRGRDRARLGVPSRARRDTARARLGLTPTTPVILAVGRQEFQKGHDVLLEAAAPLAEKVPGLQVLVAGRPGNATAALDAQRRALGLDGTVSFLGQRDDVPELLAAADVFAFPSRFEGLGGSLIEALALGVPTVASDLPVLREVAGPAACYVAPGDAGDLALGLATLLDDEETRASLAAAGRRRFEERYELDAAMDALAAIITAVAQARPRR